MVHFPTASRVADDAETTQTVEVVEEKLTARPEVDVAARVSCIPTVPDGIGSKVMFWPRVVVFEATLTSTPWPEPHPTAANPSPMTTVPKRHEIRGPTRLPGSRLFLEGIIEQYCPHSDDDWEFSGTGR